MPQWIYTGRKENPMTTTMMMIGTGTGSLVVFFSGQSLK
jgi:hypothetical protein